MNLYPALVARMGTWTYYVVKMTARELDESVRFAHDVYDDRTLSEAIQRALNKGRVNKEIVQYLQRQNDRFFASIVVAALEGNPQFYPVEVTESAEFAIFHDDERLNSSFGVLRFDGTQKYYALDGQHRLAAIKALLDRDNPASDYAPSGFEMEEFSVIVVVPDPADSDEIFLQKYRRLFANLNRYAKPTDQTTNIIMDEDDSFAIVTRRLVTEHAFFQWTGKQKESKRVKVEKGKNLTSSDPYFTSIQALYDVNIALLSSRVRENKGWGDGKEDEGVEFKPFKRFRPSEEYLESLYTEMVTYWDALIEEIPDLSSEPVTMRAHGVVADSEDEKKHTDHLLFWPIGQQMLAEVARQALDMRLPDPEHPSKQDVKEALRGLAALEWRLNRAPWTHFLLVSTEPGRWKIRSEERKEVLRIGRRIQQWVMGIDALDDKGIEQLRVDWSTRLIPAQTDEAIEAMWAEVLQQKADLQQST